MANSKVISLEEDNSELSKENINNPELPFPLLTFDWTSCTYSMNHPSRGLCLIFSHSKFQRDTNLEPRFGNLMDEERLDLLFKKLKFEVQVHNDLTAVEIEEILRKVRELDHSQNSCFICCFLTHGEEGMLWAYDTTYPIQDVLDIFHNDGNEACKEKSLFGKPKIFIIQACRIIDGEDGSDFGQRIIYKKGNDIIATLLTNQSDCVEESEESTDVLEINYAIPYYSDFVVINSTFKGYYSYLRRIDGSIFIQTLCDYIENYCDTLDLISILTLVNREIVLKYESKKTRIKASNKKKQMPCYKSYLTKMIKFPLQNPPL